jgi:hypothetical protein
MFQSVCFYSISLFLWADSSGCQLNSNQKSVHETVMKIVFRTKGQILKRSKLEVKHQRPSRKSSRISNTASKPCWERQTDASVRKAPLVAGAHPARPAAAAPRHCQRRCHQRGPPPPLRVGEALEALPPPPTLLAQGRPAGPAQGPASPRRHARRRGCPALDGGKAEGPC